MAKRIMILTASVGSGHNVAASVLEASFREEPEVEAVEVLDVLSLTSSLYHKLYGEGYFAAVDAVPWLVGWGYDANDAPFSSAEILPVWDQVNTGEVAKKIEAYQPNVIVCTHFLPARLVSLLIKRGKVHATMSVITTDYDFQGLWLSVPFNRFFVARDETRAHMVEIGLPADRITVSGIPVKAVFSQAVEREEVLARYQLRTDVPMLLISAGAAGGTYTEAIVAQTLRMRNDFQAVVSCGRNEELKDKITALVASQADRYRVVGIVNDMPDLMRAATLFVGKPGGLSSSECMAAELPMVLINPIPGQEVRNSDFLLEEGAAIRCNYATTVGYKIDCLLDDPERVKSMADNARRIGRKDAAQKIVATVLAEPDVPLWISHDAQSAIHTSAKEGLSARDENTGNSVQTLVNVATGISAGVVTLAELQTLASIVPGNVLRNATHTVTPAVLKLLKQQGADRHIRAFLKYMLGKAEEIVLRVEA
jgi:processive 1,2-diacylglycerol beta-glucosyltransferase